MVASDEFPPRPDLFQAPEQPWKFGFAEVEFQRTKNIFNVVRNGESGSPHFNPLWEYIANQHCRGAGEVQEWLCALFQKWVDFP